MNYSNERIIIFCNPSWDAADWQVEFIKSSDNEYFAKLWILDDYDGYLAEWKNYRTSPNFTTKEKVKAYVSDNWDGKEIE